MHTEHRDDVEEFVKQMKIFVCPCYQESHEQIVSGKSNLDLMFVSQEDFDGLVNDIVADPTYPPCPPSYPRISTRQ